MLQVPVAYIRPIGTDISEDELQCCVVCKALGNAQENVGEDDFLLCSTPSCLRSEHCGVFQ